MLFASLHLPDAQNPAEWPVRIAFSAVSGLVYVIQPYISDMKAHSHDLRERVAAAYAEPGAKIYQVAARFSVSLSFTDKLLRRQHTSGSVAELPRHPRR